MTEIGYKKDIVRRMKSLDIYQKEFDPTIDRLAALYVHRDKIEEQFAASGGNAVVKHTNKAGATNAIKNPFLSARDEVFTQLLAHERELGLTLAALKRIKESSMSRSKESSLSIALKGLID